MPGDEGIPTLRNFKFSNIRVNACPLLADATGIHPDKPLDGFLMLSQRDRILRERYLAGPAKFQLDRLLSDCNPGHSDDAKCKGYEDEF